MITIANIIKLKNLNVRVLTLKMHDNEESVLATYENIDLSLFANITPIIIDNATTIPIWIGMYNA